MYLKVHPRRERCPKDVARLYGRDDEERVRVRGQGQGQGLGLVARLDRGDDE